MQEPAENIPKELEAQPAPIVETATAPIEVEKPVEKLATTAQKAMIARYESDVANAMSQTDAAEIQKFIQRAKDDESLQKDLASQNKERAFISVFTTLFLVVAVAAGVYGVLHYKSLTVPLEQTVNLGVFPSFSTPLSDAELKSKDILGATLFADTAFGDKPTLVDIVDPTTKLLLSPKELFSYLHIQATEPLQTSFVVARYGFVKISDTEVVPFIVGAVENDIVANKEFLIAEPTMTSLFKDALYIDTANLVSFANGGFTQEVVANIPARILRAQKDDQRKPTLIYGFPSDKIVVFTTNIQAFARIADTIISK